MRPRSALVNDCWQVTLHFTMQMVGNVLGLIDFVGDFKDI